ncbi:MAG: recombinase RecT [Bradymonadales bacterium]
MTQTNQKGIISQATADVAEAKKPQTLIGYVKEMEGQFAKALPRVMTPERFTRIALTALRNTPALMKCSKESFLGALMNAAQLGLEPNTPLGQAYLIPYGGQCQFQIGYKGLIDLAYRSGEITTMQAHVVHENDVFDYEYGIEPKLKHVPAKSDPGKPAYVYATFSLKNGGYSFEVMSMDNVREFAKKYSKAFNNGPWQTNFEEMAKKTVLKKVLKYAPIRSDFLTAAFVTDDKTATYDDATDSVVIDYETGEVSDGAQTAQAT